MSASGSFGQILQQARIRRGLTIEQLANDTTIPVRDIEAIEAGRVDALPAAMYRRAEVRAFADAVGVDAEMVLAQLRGTPAVIGPPGPSDRRDRGLAARLLAPTAVTTVPVAPRGRDAARAGKALVVLMIGCAALLWEQAGAPSIDVNLAPALTVPALDPESLIDEAVRIAEPPPQPPSLRRALYKPGIAATGQRSPHDARLDEGVLVVHSTPGGARVTVNGVGWGVTPVAIRYLPIGTVRVRVGKTDYAVQERVVSLTADRPSATLRVTLPALARRRAAARPTTERADMLVVTTVPEGARVTVNGIGWGMTPLSIAHLPDGTQRVRVVKEQFRSEERTVTVRDGRPGRVAITLKPAS